MLSRNCAILSRWCTRLRRWWTAPDYEAISRADLYATCEGCSPAGTLARIWPGVSSPKSCLPDSYSRTATGEMESLRTQVSYLESYPLQRTKYSINTNSWVFLSANSHTRNKSSVGIEKISLRSLNETIWWMTNSSSPGSFFLRHGTSFWWFYLLDDPFLAESFLFDPLFVEAFDL